MNTRRPLLPRYPLPYPARRFSASPACARHRRAVPRPAGHSDLGGQRPDAAQQASFASVIAADRPARPRRQHL
ncbi:hypothetical protein J4732_22220 [Serratia marcescens]|uniref:Uncharacterized protein n=1 Tax=Serratia marcescens TaxID=615 RepID=A0A939SP48_SERMA|nr:hypothetical protein [Serratia marcescens]